MKIIAAILIASATLASLKKPADPKRSLTENERLWHDVEPVPERVWQIEKAATLYGMTHKRYETVEKMRSPGCPAAVIFVFAYRESDANFGCHLHEGSPLTGRTKYVPKGRPLHPDPPYKWEQSAEDALYVIKNYQNPAKWDRVDHMVDTLTSMNGYGYRSKGIPSPYLVGGTNLQKPGKYVRDHVFDRTVMDKQLGVLPILKAIERKGLFTPPPYDP